MNVYCLAALAIEVGDPEQLKQGGTLKVYIDGQYFMTVPLIADPLEETSFNPWDAQGSPRSRASSRTRPPGSWSRATPGRSSTSRRGNSRKEVQTEETPAPAGAVEAVRPPAHAPPGIVRWRPRASWDLFGEPGLRIPTSVLLPVGRAFPPLTWETAWIRGTLPRPSSPSPRFTWRN